MRALPFVLLTLCQGRYARARKFKPINTSIRQVAVKE